MTALDQQGHSDPTSEELKRVLNEMLSTLHLVGRGELSVRLTTSLPEDHPGGALVASLNGMVDALREAREQSAASERRLQDQLRTIEAQRTAIRELSTPVIEVLPSVLCVPIVGILDSRRAAELTSTLLDAVVSYQARHAIIDITGIDVMDTSTCDYFLRMVRSVAMLGSECVLSGINPTIANTIVQMDTDLAGVKSFRSLRHALMSIVLGPRPSRDGRPGDEPRQRPRQQRQTRK